MNCEYVRDYYKVPACIGRRVMAYGKPGIIAKDRGHYIGVTLDTDKPGRVRNYHPTDGMEYLEMGKVRKVSRSASRYAFGEWLKNQWYRPMPAERRSWPGEYP